LYIAFYWRWIDKIGFIFGARESCLDAFFCSSSRMGTNRHREVLEYSVMRERSKFLIPRVCLSICGSLVVAIHEVSLSCKLSSLSFHIELVKWTQSSFVGDSVTFFSSSLIL
jgi:hypothetical protein